MSQQGSTRTLCLCVCLSLSAVLVGTTYCLPEIN